MLCWLLSRAAFITPPQPRRLPIEKDRVGAYYQSISQPVRGLPPAGKVLVVQIEYQPPPAMQTLHTPGAVVLS